MGASKPLPTSPKREEKCIRTYYGYLSYLLLDSWFKNFRVFCVFSVRKNKSVFYFSYF